MIWYKDVPVQVDAFIKTAPHEVVLPNALPCDESGGTSTSAGIYDETEPVFWRLLNHSRTLEVVYIPLQSPSLYGPRARFTFPAPLLGQIHFYKDGENLTAAACTEEGTLHAITINVDRGSTRLSGHDSVRSYKWRAIQGLEPQLFHMVSKDTYIVVDCFGDVHMLGEASGQPKEIRLSGTRSVASLRSISSYIIRSLGRSTSTDNMPSKALCINSVGSSMLKQHVMIYTQDFKVQFWSLYDLRCVKTIDLLDALDPEVSREEYIFSQSLRSGCKNLLWTCESNGNTFLITYLPDDTNSRFLFYQLQLDDEGTLVEVHFAGDKLCGAEDGELLIDFVVQHSGTGNIDVNAEPGRPSSYPILWALWSLQNETILRYTPLNVSTSSQDEEIADGTISLEKYGAASILLANEKWYRVANSSREAVDVRYFETVMSLDNAQILSSLPQTIFAPGRFSKRSLVTGLQKYVEQNATIANATNIRPSATIFQLMETAHNSVANVVSPVDNAFGTQALREAEYRGKLKKEWLRISALCEQAEIANTFPIALHVNSRSQGVFCIKRESVSVYRYMDSLEAAYQHCLLSGESFDVSSFMLTPSKYLEPFYHSIASAETRSSIVKLCDAFNIIQSLLTPQNVIAIKAELKRLMATTSKDSIEAVGQHFYEQYLRKELDRDPSTKTRLIHVLRNCEHLEDTIHELLQLLTDNTDLASYNMPREPPTSFAVAVIASGAAQTVKCRYELAQHLFLALSIIVYLNPRYGFVKHSNKLLSKAFGTLHFYVVWNYLATVPEQISQWQSVKGNSAMDIDSPADDYTRYGIYHALICDVRQLGVNDANLPLGIAHSISTFLSDFEAAKAHERESRALVRIVCCLHRRGYHEAVLGVLEYLPQDAATLYFSACAYLSRRDFDIAKEYFERAGTGLGSTVTKQNYMSELLKDECGEDSPRAYYSHVADMFAEQRSPQSVVYFSKLALHSLKDKAFLPENLQHTTALHNVIFANSLQEKDWDEAYFALMSMADEKTKIADLSAFVRALCEQGNIQKLCEYPFVGMQEHVERILTETAAIADITSTPNYYKILYAYYAMKSDWQKASWSMYAYADSLEQASANRPFVDVTTELANSYLAALVAMQLVHGDSARLVMANGSRNVLSKRRKIEDGQIEQIQVINLRDIEQKYYMAKAKLELGWKAPELQSTAVAAEPAAIVRMYSVEGNFEKAINLATLFDQDLSNIFADLAHRCIILATAANPDESAAWLLQNDITANFQGSLVDTAWYLLKELLNIYDTEKTAYRYRAVALDSLLKGNPKLKIPAWLSKFYQLQNTDDLIRVCLRNWSLEQAAMAAISKIKAEMTLVRPVTSKTFSRWLPYTLIDNLLNILEEVQENAEHPIRRQLDLSASDIERLSGVELNLRRTLQEYLEKVRRESLEYQKLTQRN
ncbi:hypothetical protein BZG36_00816 [Bifiguratus adelaidae]|uniref:Uncharacterized protein n=1 Tax=Bifiguratus adelaidae TaxID=1938954 RepID=A0A261Y6T1_9FUNG|nr:hypothetical protein BZG36_00816 [Bifiguratus adelaidae]